MAAEKKPAEPRPYIVQRRLQLDSVALSDELLAAVGADELWVECGTFEAVRATDAMKAAGAKDYATPPPQTTTANYRAFPVGNDTRLDLLLEVKPVFTWE